jgi:hypothetical protein
MEANNRNKAEYIWKRFKLEIKDMKFDAEVMFLLGKVENMLRMPEVQKYFPITWKKEGNDDDN